MGVDDLEGEVREYCRSNENAVVIIDIDNLKLSAQAFGHNFDEAEICKVIKNYVRRMGDIFRIELHLTINTTNFSNIVHFCYDMDITVVVVPPTPEAADDEIRKTFKFGLLCPEVKLFVLASGDSGFRKICHQAVAAGRRVHVITVVSNNGLVNDGIGTASLIDLMAESQVITSPEEKRQSVVVNQYSGIATRLKDEGHAFVPQPELREEFFWECYQCAGKVLLPGEWRSFKLLVNEVWGTWMMTEEWEQKGLSWEDCRRVLTALVSAGIIKNGTRILSGGQTKAYSM